MTDSADDAPLAPGSFLAPLPWWVVLERGTGAVSVHPETGAVTVRHGGPTPVGFLVLDADGATCLAAFTDEDLAARFVAETGFPGVPAPAATPGEFLRLAEFLPPVCTYVSFDPPARVGGRAKWVVPLAEVLAAVERASNGL